MHRTLPHTPGGHLTRCRCLQLAVTRQCHHINEVSVRVEPAIELLDSLVALVDRSDDRVAAVFLLHDLTGLHVARTSSVHTRHFAAAVTGMSPRLIGALCATLLAVNVTRQPKAAAM
jgi:hypothetical protein